MPVKLTIQELKPGDRVKVFTINSANKNHLRKLAVFGIIPGMEVELLQVKPAYVLRIGYTELALDSEIAKSMTFIR
ncbi:MAG: ferrous iron transport protein A [Veillonellaceae bacterium]|jgi:ferrous iron transport protein A|nr:ferrous iron transport protein A [Veillonellaceae bacterium]